MVAFRSPRRHGDNVAGVELSSTFALDIDGELDPR
jgi:hypothetical protein